MAKKKRSKHKFSSSERRAYNVGVGVGLAGDWEEPTARAYLNKLNKKETESFLKGYVRANSVDKSSDFTVTNARFRLNKK